MSRLAFSPHPVIRTHANPAQPCSLLGRLLPGRRRLRDQQVIERVLAHTAQLLSCEQRLSCQAVWITAVRRELQVALDAVIAVLAARSDDGDLGDHGRVVAARAERLLNDSRADEGLTALIELVKGVEAVRELAVLAHQDSHNARAAFAGIAVTHNNLPRSGPKEPW